MVRPLGLPARLLAAASTLALACGEEAASLREVERASTSPLAWAEDGFVELVPPIRPPTSSDGRDTITVWLRLPAGARITTELSAGEPRLRMPAGAELDRVEYFTNGDALDTAVVEDVRGTTFAKDGEEFHVLRRRGQGLVGRAWLRDDPDGQREADRWLASILAPRDRERLVALNQCAGCHVPDKPASERLQEGAMPHRKTDVSGLYHPQAVLETETPIEVSRPHDPNLADPFIRMRCASGDLVVREHRGSRSPRCSDGTVPLASLDVRAALAVRDPHALAVCESRRYLFEHLDEVGQAAFERAFLECGITPHSVSDR